MKRIGWMAVVEVYTLVLHDILGEGVPIRTAAAAALATSNMCMRADMVFVCLSWRMCGAVAGMYMYVSICMYMYRLSSLCIYHASMLYVYNNCICSLGRMQCRHLAVVPPYGYALRRVFVWRVLCAGEVWE